MESATLAASHVMGSASGRAALHLPERRRTKSRSPNAWQELGSDKAVSPAMQVHFVVPGLAAENYMLAAILEDW